MVRSLAGKVALITGASRGLGREISRALWREGARVVLVSRRAESLMKLADELMASRSDEQDACTVVADLAEPDAIARIADQIAMVSLKVDIVVNNAAIIGPIGPVWENDWDAWRETIRVNLLAPIELCRAFVPEMVLRRWGKIVNLSGGGATSSRPNFTAYATAKAGLVRFSENLAMELVPTNVQVNCVAPGAMNTDMSREILLAGPEKAGIGEHLGAIQGTTAVSAVDAMRRAAVLCVYLASPSSGQITGKLISAVWDPWPCLEKHAEELRHSDIYTLRRIVPRDRGLDW